MDVPISLSYRPVFEAFAGVRFLILRQCHLCHFCPANVDFPAQPRGGELGKRCRNPASSIDARCKAIADIFGLAVQINECGRGPRLSWLFFDVLLHIKLQSHPNSSAKLLLTSYLVFAFQIVCQIGAGGCKSPDTAMVDGRVVRPIFTDGLFK